MRQGASSRVPCTKHYKHALGFLAHEGTASGRGSENSANSPRQQTICPIAYQTLWGMIKVEYFLYLNYKCFGKNLYLCTLRVFVGWD